MEKVRDITVYKHYFYDFFDELTVKVQSKIDHVLYVVTVSKIIPVKFFKHVEGTDGLFEIRVEYEGNIYRIFCCFDEEKLIVLFNGFQKKTQKIPQNVIEKALMIKEQYFKSKKKNGKK